MLRIHNSLTGRKEALQPIVPGKVGMYVCGITVYDYCHIGHARSQVAFDIVRRWLRASGLDVTYVRNITDIDDKIIRRAAENDESIDALTGRFIEAMNEDFATLGIERPDHEPRATQYLPAIVAMIAALVGKGYAYVAADGDVLYAVERFAGYGRLSGKKLGDLEAGARVEVDAGKRNPLDFVLWKAAKPGEPAWDSPWGAGRPGWHIECSAMSIELLGTHFDIHGGGMDLKFPHHENEIAQSCAATGDGFANVWLHNGFVNVDEEKMSKSLGNFFTVRDVLPTLRHAEVLRYFLVSSHYRGPINYSTAQLAQADAALTRLYTALRGLAPQPLERTHTAAQEEFGAAMDDDFNTPQALAVLQGLARDLNLARAAGDAKTAQWRANELVALGNVLGLLTVDAEQWFRLGVRGAAGEGALDAATIGALIDDRLAARKAKDWAESDRIRDQLAAAGILLEDKPGGRTEWRRR
ncbi:MAG: cysteine--tRNA ligase [Steroidobacteraceae bacterium]